MKTPADLSTLRAFFDAVNWPQIEAEVAQETKARLVIVGPVNSGKSTLFNTLKGQSISAVTAVPGTTKTAITETFGPFTLVDTPGFGEISGDDHARIAHAELARATLVILLLDASAGVRQSDLELYNTIQEHSASVVVVLNKIDLVRDELARILNDLSFRLRGVQVVPISAQSGTGITDKLIPALIGANPALAVVIGRALPRYREAAADRIIQSAMWWALILGVEPIPGLDLPLLLGMQARMILRLAAIYGENFNARHARELLTTIAGGLVTRYIGMELAKFVPGLGWIVAGIVAATGTRTMGKVAKAYFVSGRRLTAPQLRAWYEKLLKRPNTRIELPPEPPPTDPPAP